MKRPVDLKEDSTWWARITARQIADELRMVPLKNRRKHLTELMSELRELKKRQPKWRSIPEVLHAEAQAQEKKAQDKGNIPLTPGLSA